MSGYRIGDRDVEIAGQSYRLRLTVSALAEIASVFEADSPKALAGVLRTASLADWNRVLRCVATPKPAPLDRDNMVQIMPDISALITEGLRA